MKKIPKHIFLAWILFFIFGTSLVFAVANMTLSVLTGFRYSAGKQDELMLRNDSSERFSFHAGLIEGEWYWPKKPFDEHSKIPDSNSLTVSFDNAVSSYGRNKKFCSSCPEGKCTPTAKDSGWKFEFDILK